MNRDFLNLIEQFVNGVKAEVNKSQAVIRKNYKTISDLKEEINVEAGKVAELGDMCKTASTAIGMVGDIASTISEDDFDTVSEVIDDVMVGDYEDYEEDYDDEDEDDMLDDANDEDEDGECLDENGEDIE